MQQNNPVRGNIDKLTFDERGILENKVLPTARRWVAEYPAGSTLHEHGLQTLRHWGQAA